MIRDITINAIVFTSSVMARNICRRSSALTSAGDTGGSAAGAADEAAPLPAVADLPLPPPSLETSLETLDIFVSPSTMRRTAGPNSACERETARTQTTTSTRVDTSLPSPFHPLNNRKCRELTSMRSNVTRVVSSTVSCSRPAITVS